MNKNIKNTIALSALLAFSFANAQSVTEIPYAENINPSTIERTFYNKGFKDGLEIGIRKGYAQAKKEHERDILKYANIIKGYESGKYLSKKGKVTPPRVYQKRRGGTVELLVKGCEIRGSLSPSDILKLPKYYDVSGGMKSQSVEVNHGKKDSLSDGVFLSGIDNDNNEGVAKPTSSIKQTSTMVLPDTQFYRNLLRSSGTLFSIESGGGGLKAVFSSPKSRKSFIESYQLEYGKDYK